MTIHLKYIFLFLTTVAALSSCKDDDSTKDHESPEAEGLAYSESDKVAINVYTNIITTLNNNEDISIVAEVDHGCQCPNRRVRPWFYTHYSIWQPEIGNADNAEKPTGRPGPPAKNHSI